MARLDMRAIHEAKKKKENFDILMEFLKTNKEYQGAYWYILSLQEHNEAHLEQLKRYEAFFSALDNFLPRRPSIHDRIA